MVDQTEPPFYCDHGHDLRVDKYIGLYRGPCEKLADKEVDMAGFPDGLNYWENHFFEPIGVYHIVTRRLISAKPRKEPKSQTTIKYTLLISVAVAYISFVCILFLIEAVRGNRNINDYIWIMFEVFSILCLEGVRFRYLRGMRQLMTGLWLLTAFFVISKVLFLITA